jgi:hypothetical protein
MTDFQFGPAIADGKKRGANRRPFPDDAKENSEFVGQDADPDKP